MVRGNIYRVSLLSRQIDCERSTEAYIKTSNTQNQIRSTILEQSVIQIFLGMAVA